MPIIPLSCPSSPFSSIFSRKLLQSLSLLGYWLSPLTIIISFLTLYFTVPPHNYISIEPTWCEILELNIVGHVAFASLNAPHVWQCKKMWPHCKCHWGSYQNFIYALWTEALILAIVTTIQKSIPKWDHLLRHFLPWSFLSKTLDQQYFQLHSHVDMYWKNIANAVSSWSNLSAI